MGSHMSYSRRSFLIVGLGLLATGCSRQSTSNRLPSTPWTDDDRDLADVGRRSDDWRARRQADIAKAAGSRPATTTTTSSLPPGVMSRSSWATGSPIPSRMDPMTRIHRITVHHDGMNAFWSDSESASRARLDSIRRSHQGAGWGDIGYHYVVDRSGRVWEGRPLVYQGAHVKDHNPGNIGVMCLGNFELQSPSQPQLASLHGHLRYLLTRHRVSRGSMFTHRELRPTLCPGRSLQGYMVNMRSNGSLA